ncbi:MAG: M2 family metallopeptidase [Candidatus Eisenbacteria bacterium]
MSMSTTVERREHDLAVFIEELVAELRPLELEHNHEFWLANTTGEAIHAQRSGDLDAQIRKIFARVEPYRQLQALAEGGPLADPLLQRQLILLLNAYRSKQIAPEMIEQQVRLEKSLEGIFNSYRAELDGQKVPDNRIHEVLQTSNDPAMRERAWEASKQVGTRVETQLLELVRLRNEGARLLGFEHYYSMSLQLDELDEGELFALLDELERGTQPLWNAYKHDLDARLAARFGCRVDELRAWHYADPFFQEAPAAEVDLDPYYAGKDIEKLTEDYFRAIGFEIRDLLDRADLYEREGKCQHAFCMSLDRGGDIRVLCNVKCNEKWMGTMLHEYGHAVYDKYVDRSLPWLLRGQAHILSTEASAMLFGRLSKTAQWMQRWAGADPAELAKYAEPVARAVREQLLVQTRWELVMIHMERELYRDPSQDLRTLWWDLVERFQGVKRPEGRHEPDWAAKIHFSIAPVYYHNYLLGEMLASQLQDHLLTQVLGGGTDVWARYVESTEVGDFMKLRFYAGGRRVNWRSLTAEATGRPLDSRAFVEELAGRGSSA